MQAAESKNYSGTETDLRNTWRSRKPSRQTQLEPTFVIFAPSREKKRVAAANSTEDARRLRDWLAESDAGRDPKVWVLRLDVVLCISEQIIQESTPYLRTREAAPAALREIKKAPHSGELRIPQREVAWLDRLQKQVDSLPNCEADWLAKMLLSSSAAKFLPRQYGLV